MQSEAPEIRRGEACLAQENQIRAEDRPSRIRRLRRARQASPLEIRA